MNLMKRSDEGPSPSALTETDRIMSSLVREGRAPSYVYAVFDRTGIVSVDGDGPDVKGLDAATMTHLRFRIASMSKSFTAAAILRMVRTRLIDLETPVRDVVPEMSHVRRFRADDPDITVADLLSMRSGLPTDDAWADRQESMGADGLRGILERGVRTVFSPGEGYEYSNLGFAILGEVIRTITGEEPTAYIESRIMRPLGLQDTTYDYRAAPADMLVIGRHRIPPSLTSPAKDADGASWADEPFTSPGAFSVIGGVISSVHDVAIWDRWLESAFDDPRPTDRMEKVLPGALRRTMQTGHTPIPPILRTGSSRGHLTRSDRSDIASYGYGLRIEHVPGMGDVIGHSGGYPGYGSHMRWHRQSGLGIVALANGRYATPGIPASKALDVLVHEAMSRRRAAGKTVRPWPETLYAVRRITEALSSTGDAMRRGDDIGEACRTALSSITDVFAMNIELDADLESRARGLSEMLGILCGPPSARVAGMLSTLHADTPAQATWIIPCERHPLQCSITLTPLSPPGIQTLDFRVADEPATDDVTETRLTSIIDLSEGDAICAATEETAAASAGRTALNDTDTGIITGTKDGGE